MKHLFLKGGCVQQTEDVIVESEESGEDGDETPGETIKELKARKAELRQRVEDQARDKHTLQVTPVFVLCAETEGGGPGARQTHLTGNTCLCPVC